MTVRPPRLAEWLLRRRLPATEREDLIGDLAELYAGTYRASGRLQAWLSYWREASALLWHAKASGDTEQSAGWLHGLRHDAAAAIRLNMRRPAESVIAVVTLAVALGMTTAVLSAARVLLFDRLPGTSPHALVRIDESEAGQILRALSEPDVRDWRAQSHLFTALTAYSTAARAWTGRESAERLALAEVDDTFFDTFGVAPAEGRFVASTDLDSGAERVAVLTTRFWRSRFGGDREVIGQRIILDQVPFRIVGIAPEAFVFPEDAQLWVSSQIPAVFRDRRFHLLNAIGRLAPGVTVEQAQAAAAVVAADLSRRDPAVHGARGVVVSRLQDFVARDVRTPVQFLLLASGLVLLVSCTNVSGLMLTRTSDRWREFGTRAALGASRGRLTRLIAVDIFGLTGLAAALGLGMAVILLQAVRSFAPAALAQRDQIALDGTVGLWCVAIAFIAALMTVSLPALQLRRLHVLDALGTGRGVTSRRAGRHALVALQLAAAVALLVCGLLLTRSFTRLLAVDPGFQSAHTVNTPVRLPLQKYPKREQYTQRLETLLSRVSAADGVTSAALTFAMPLTNARFEVEVRRPEPDATASEVLLNMVTPHYFRTLRIPMQHGRPFESTDTPQAPQVAIVSARLAAMLWGTTDAVGQWLHGGGPGDRWQIVGVAADVKDRELSAETRPMVYRPFAQFPTNSVNLVVRGDGQDVAALAAQVRTLVASFDRDIPVDGVVSVDSYVAASLARARFSAALVGAFASATLLIAMIGLYAAMAYTVKARRSEIGLRVALGATRRDIAGGVARDVVIILCSGIGAGVLAGVVGAQLFRELLFNVAPLDLTSVAVAAVAAILAGGLASMGALRAALRVDPARTLHLT